MRELRGDKIEELAGKGKLVELKSLLEPNHTQLELDIALENAIAYSQIPTAEYLLTLGADFSNYDYQGVYYAVHNNEIEGVKFSIAKGVDINVKNGMLLNMSIMTATNTKDIEMVRWLLSNGADPKYLTKDTLEVLHRFGNKDLQQLIKNVI